MIGATTETLMWGLIAEGNLTARNAMITGHYGMIEALARKMTNGGGQDQFDELLGNGMLSLCESVDTYIEKRPKARFSTHSFMEARRVMIKHLRTDGVVTKTEWSSRVHTKFKKQQAALAQKLGRTPTNQEYTDFYGSADPTHMYAAVSVPVEEVHDIEEEASIDMEKLSPASRFLLDAISQGATLGEVASQTGIPRSTIEQHANAVVEWI